MIVCNVDGVRKQRAGMRKAATQEPVPACKRRHGSEAYPVAARPVRAAGYVRGLHRARIIIYKMLAVMPGYGVAYLIVDAVEHGAVDAAVMFSLRLIEKAALSIERLGAVEEGEQAITFAFKSAVERLVSYGHEYQVFFLLVLVII